MAKFTYNIYRNKDSIEKGSDEIELYSSKYNYWTFKVSDWGLVDDFEYEGNKLVVKKLR